MAEKTIEILSSEKCTGCYACANACPTDAIQMQPDAEGFPRPNVNRERCIDCGRCITSCPVLSYASVIVSKPQEVYAAGSLDEKIRYESTSGGVFSELAIAWLNRGGFLCGAWYGEGHRIEHAIVDSREGLDRIRQSKYAQSDIGTCFRCIRDLLRRGKQVLFCGSPCQCAGLLTFLGDKPDGLFIANFVCRGTNSPKAYEAFLRWLEECYGSIISRVWFKNKALGWKRFSTRVEFEDGQVYSKDRYHDLFIRGYIEQNLYMRECCHTCEFRDLSRTGDITLADFWGVKLADKTKDADAGTSLVIVNTEFGRELFEAVKPRLFWEHKSMEDAFPGNACITDSPEANPMRSYFLSRLGEMPFDKLCAECFKKPAASKRLLYAVKGGARTILHAIGLKLFGGSMKG